MYTTIKVGPFAGEKGKVVGKAGEYSKVEVQGVQGVLLYKKDELGSDKKTGAAAFVNKEFEAHEKTLEKLAKKGGK